MNHSFPYGCVSRASGASRVSLEGGSRCLAARPLRARAAALRALACVALCVVVACVACVAPRAAFAGTDVYEGPVSQLDVDATVNPAGALLATQALTTTFDEPERCVRVDVGGLPVESIYGIDAVYVAADDATGEEGAGSADEPASVQTLQPVAFNVDWREGAADEYPEQPCYAFDEVRHDVYVFGDFSGTVRISVAYTARFAVQGYADCAELFWHFKAVGCLPADNLTVNVKLPVPSGRSLELGDEVFAWVHAPEGSSIEASDDGVVAFFIPQVAKDQFVELRVVFPNGWLSGLDREAANAHRDIWHLDQAFQDEHSWSNFMRRWALVDSGRLALSCGFAFVVLAWGLVSLARFARSEKTRPDQPRPTYWQAHRYRLIGVAGLTLAVAVVAAYVFDTWQPFQASLAALALLAVCAQFVRSKGGRDA